MAKITIGQVRPKDAGIWNATATYQSFEYVIYNNTAYLARKNVPSGIVPEDISEYWVLLGARGDSTTNASINDNGHLILTIG